MLRNWSCLLHRRSAEGSLRQAELVEPRRGDVFEGVFLTMAQALKIDRGQDSLDPLREPLRIIGSGEGVTQRIGAQTVQRGPDLGPGGAGRKLPGWAIGTAPKGASPFRTKTMCYGSMANP